MTYLDRARPVGPRVYIVRWRRLCRDEWKHRVYLRRHPAREFLAKLDGAGREAVLFESEVTWR